MPVFIIEDRHYLFVHVPKTGGTSLEVVFSRSGSSIAHLDYGAGGSLNHLCHCSPQHMHGEALQSQFVLDRFDGIFMVTRNPYDRFRSEYCMANSGNFDLSASAVEAWAEKVFADYAEDNYVLDNHIRPQHEFYISGANVWKFELGFTNITREIANCYNINLVRDDVRELARNRHSGIVSGDVELNRAVTDMINQHYDRDFKQFGYDMNT